MFGQIYPQLTILLLPFLLITNPSSAQPGQPLPNGTIVPFSILPMCASMCGPLFDVQAACSPPVLPSVNLTCFCADKRLQALRDKGGESTVCGEAICGDTMGLSWWYEGVCGNSTSASSASGTSTTTGSIQMQLPPTTVPTTTTTSGSSSESIQMTLPPTTTTDSGSTSIQMTLPPTTTAAGGGNLTGTAITITSGSKTSSQSKSSGVATTVSKAGAEMGRGGGTGVGVGVGSLGMLVFGVLGFGL